MGWNFNLSAWYQHSQLEELEELVSPIWRSFDWKVLPNPLGPWIVFFIPIKIEITCRYRVHCQTHPYSYNLQQTIANTTRYRKTVHIGAEDHRASAGITCHYHWWNVTTMWHRWENIWSIWYFGLLRACRWLWAPVIRLYFVFSMPKALSLSQPFLGWWFQLCAQYLSHTMLLTLQTASNVQSVLDVISVLKKTDSHRRMSRSIRQWSCLWTACIRIGMPHMPAMYVGLASLALQFPTTSAILNNPHKAW